VTDEYRYIVENVDAVFDQSVRNMRAYVGIVESALAAVQSETTRVSTGAQ